MAEFKYGKYLPASEEEKIFLGNYNPDKWKKASNTTDIAVFAKNKEELYLLLIKRGNYPYKGMYCLPGGFINMNESLDQTAARELQEETGLKSQKLLQVYTYGEPGREPRDRSITTLYSTVVNLHDINVSAGDDAADTDWVKISDYKKDNRRTAITLTGKNIYKPVIEHLDYGLCRIVETGGIAFDHARLIIDAYEFMILKKFPGIE